MTSSSKTLAGAILAGLDEATKPYWAHVSASNRDAEAINATAAALRAENVQRARSGVRVATDAANFDARNLALKTRAVQHFEARARVAHTTIAGLQAAVRSAADAVSRLETMVKSQAEIIDALRADRTTAHATIADLQAKLTEAEARLSRYGPAAATYGNR